VRSLEVDSFDSTAGEVEKVGGNVAPTKFAVPRTFWLGCFVDPEGNTLDIFQVEANAGE
jgi:predicted enzyme related to lactoylglutathione lyase